MKKALTFFIIVFVFVVCLVFYTKCDMTPIEQYPKENTVTTEQTVMTSETTKITETKTETTKTETETETPIITSTRETEPDRKADLVAVDIFDLTYFIPRPDQSADGLRGGSGRELIDCSQGTAGVMGSVACKRIVDKYGYSNNGKRTTIYLDVPDMPELTGYYFVDDCCSSDCVIDLYYSTSNHCPFENIGVVHNAMCYVFTEEG
jgi:hypothetical protein